jgi:hypothetical protein
MSDYNSFEPAGSHVDLSDFDDDFSSAESPSFDEVPFGEPHRSFQNFSVTIPCGLTTGGCKTKTSFSTGVTP